MDKIPVMAIENIGMVSEKLYRNTLNRQKNKNIQPGPKQNNILTYKKSVYRAGENFRKISLV